MANSVKMAKEAFTELALKPENNQELTNYLYRTGIDHFIDAKDFKKAGKALLNLYWLLNLSFSNLSYTRVELSYKKFYFGKMC